MLKLPMSIVDEIPMVSISASSTEPPNNNRVTNVVARVGVVTAIQNRDAVITRDTGRVVIAVAAIGDKCSEHPFGCRDCQIDQTIEGSIIKFLRFQSAAMILATTAIE